MESQQPQAAVAMNILIFTFGSRGDVQPYVALGTALRRGGHQVCLSTGQGFDDMIAAHGLTAAPLSINYRELIDTPEAQAAFRSMSGKFRAMRAFKDVVCEQFREMWELSREVRPDVIIYHPKGFIAQDIAAALGAVAIPTTLQPSYVATSEFPNPFLPFTNLGAFGNKLSHHFIERLTFWAQRNMEGRWRKEMPARANSTSRGTFFGGHDPEGRTVPRLHGYSSIIVNRPRDWTAREHITGYWFFEPNTDWEPAEDLHRFLATGPPPVYVGFGSMPAADAQSQTGMVIEALRQAGQRGILATGWGGLKPLAGSANDVLFLDVAPHDWLFQRCAAVVHHGGAGTTHEGLRWGRPTVICPLGVDQPYWGRRVNALGAGPPPLPQKSLNVADLSRAIGESLKPGTVARAAKLGEAIRAEGGADAAAAVVNGFVVGAGRPHAS